VTVILCAAYRRWPFRPHCTLARHALPCRLRPGWLRAMGPDCFEGS
jgi:hypothetical protein